MAVDFQRSGLTPLLAAASLPGTDDSSDESTSLPFPAALPRADFLAADFDATEYLSSLPHRHQTLEDLRAELRDRSAAVSAELVELVNANYTAFLSLGSELSGGHDKVEDVKVSLLTFRRQVEDIQSRVRSRAGTADRLCRELRQVRTGVESARKMIDMSDRLDVLEARLTLSSSHWLPGQPGAGGVDVASLDNDSEHDDEEEDEEELDDGAVPQLVGTNGPRQLAALARQYRKIEKLGGVVGKDHPFVSKLEERLTRCKNTILLDLSTALKQASSTPRRNGRRIIQYLNTYTLLGAQAQAVKDLRRN